MKISGLIPVLANIDKIHKFTIAVTLLMLSGAVTGTSYLHGNGLAAKLENGNLSYYHSDYLGSTRAITDELGAVIEEQKTLPFGGVLEGDEKYGFTGKELDESGLQYFGARYYDSTTGRFISTDPLLQYHSPYLYAGNNPLAYRDLDGRSAGAVAAPFLAPLGPGGWIALGFITASPLIVAGAIQWSESYGGPTPALNDPGIRGIQINWDESYTVDSRSRLGNLVTYPANADALSQPLITTFPEMPIDMTRMFAEGTGAGTMQAVRDLGLLKGVNTKAVESKGWFGRVFEGKSNIQSRLYLENEG